MHWDSHNALRSYFQRCPSQCQYLSQSGQSPPPRPALPPPPFFFFVPSAQRSQRNPAPSPRNRPRRRRDPRPRARPFPRPRRSVPGGGLRRGGAAASARAGRPPPRGRDRAASTSAAAAGDVSPRRVLRRPPPRRGRAAAASPPRAATTAASDDVATRLALCPWACGLGKNVSDTSVPSFRCFSLVLILSKRSKCHLSASGGELHLGQLPGVSDLGIARVSRSARLSAADFRASSLSSLCLSVSLSLSLLDSGGTLKREMTRSSAHSGHSQTGTQHVSLTPGGSPWAVWRHETFPAPYVVPGRALAVSRSARHETLARRPPRRSPARGRSTSPEVLGVQRFARRRVSCPSTSPEGPGSRLSARRVFRHRHRWFW